VGIFSKKDILFKNKEWVLDFLGEEVLILDLNYKILYANKKFLDNRGKSLPEIIGGFCYQIFHNFDKPCQVIDKVCPLNEVLKSSLPTKVTHKKGERYLEICASPLKNKKGEIIGIIELFRDVTEKEKEKRESEEKYKNLIEKSNDAVAILQDNQIKLVNQRLVDLIGYSREELKTLDFRNGIAPEFRDMVIDRYTRRQRGEEVLDHYEFALLTKNGQKKDVEMRVALIEYQGKVASYCFLKDITEKKKAETELKKVKDYLDNIINISQVAITVIDNEGNFPIFNQGAERLTGYKAEEVIGKKRVFDLYADKREAEYIKKKILENGLIENFETTLLKKDGSQIPVSISVSLLRDQQGKTIGSIGISTDITERKKMEQMLSESLERFQDVAANSGDWIWEVDEKGCYTYSSPVVEQILGYKPDEVLGRHFYDFFHPDDREELKKAAFEAFDKKEAFVNFSNQNLHKNGHTVVLETSGIPILGDNGKLLGYRGTDRDITERKKAEEALRENEEKFRNLAEQSPNMIFINKKGRVVYANQRCEEIMGYSRQEFYSPDFDFLTLIAPGCIDLVKSSFSRHMKSEEVAPFEYTLITKEGKKIEAILTTKLITFKGENAFLGIVTDITERKMMEQKIIQANKELSALNAISSMVSQSLNLEVILKETMDKILEVTDCQAGGIYILNQTNKELELKVFRGLSAEAVKGVDKLKLGEGFSGRIALTGEPIMVEDITQDPRLTRLVMRKEGLHSYLGVPLKSKGKIVGTLFVITQKGRKYNSEEVQLLLSIGNQIGMAMENAHLFKEAEQWIIQLEAIRNITNRLNKLNDVRNVAFAVMDEIKKVIEFDNCRVFLLSENREELIPIAFGSEVEEYKGETEEVLRLKIGEGITGWVAQTGEAQVIDDGERHPRSRHVPGSPYVDESIIASPMIYEEEVRGVITLSKLGLKQFNQNHLTLLNILANEAVVAIENAKLFESLKQAYAKLKEAQEQLIQSEKLRALGEMAGGVAHDFNNLLGAILGRAQLLLLSTPEAKTKKGLKIIEKAALDGAETVRRIQEFTRLRADEDFIMLDLNEILRESLEITKHKWKDEAQKKGVLIQVETSLNKDLSLVAGNPSELREVFVNMILNAVDAMPKGGTLSLFSELKEDRILAWVTDTGIGMSEEVKRKVFDPFFTTKGPKGNGLGMSLAYGIIVRHNGKISIESQEGKGTTFTVELPEGKIDDKERIQDKISEGTRAENILIIDDEPAIRELLCDILQSKGHRAVAVDNSLKGLELFEKEDFGIVFTDLSMPEMSGWEVVDKLRSLKPEVVIVMITGWGTQVDSKNLKAHSVDLLMAKPFEVKKLFEILNQAQGIRKDREKKRVDEVTTYTNAS